MDHTVQGVEFVFGNIFATHESVPMTHSFDDKWPLNCKSKITVFVYVVLSHFLIYFHTQGGGKMELHALF